MRNTFRHGDTMIAVESTPATVAFADILAATRVVDDNHNSEAPWEMWDGWAHTATPARDFANARAMQGYCYADGDRIVLRLPSGDSDGVYKYARERGATRQVAAEMLAEQRRQVLARLVKWYENGWQWYGVRCTFEALGEEYEDSIWGIDDPDYAATDIANDVAAEVAARLEEAGFTVTGRPKHRGPTRQEKQANIRRNLNHQNWKPA